MIIIVYTVDESPDNLTYPNRSPARAKHPVIWCILNRLGFVYGDLCCLVYIFAVTQLNSRLAASQNSPGSICPEKERPV